MRSFKKLHFLRSLLIFNLFVSNSIAQHNRTNYCGKITTQKPFLNQNSSITSLLRSMTLCRSQNLYFRTSLGLFQVSSVDYNGRLLTISPSSCSSSVQYVSPLAVTAGFPSPPEPSSLLLFNCSSKRDFISPSTHNCRGLYKCGNATSSPSESKEQEKRLYSCLVVDDIQKMDKGFHPKHLNCSHFSWVHRRTSDQGGDYEGYELGTRLSFDMPDHLPDLCKECKKPNGNCGAGLKCLCHAKECTDKVISMGGSLKSIGYVLFSWLSCIVVMAFLMDI